MLSAAKHSNRVSQPAMLLLLLLLLTLLSPTSSPSHTHRETFIRHKLLVMQWWVGRRQRYVADTRRASRSRAAHTKPAAQGCAMQEQRFTFSLTQRPHANTLAIPLLDLTVLTASEWRARPPVT